MGAEPGTITVGGPGEMAAARRRRVRVLQWSLVAVFATVGALLVALPAGRHEYRTAVVHVPLVLALAGGAAYIAWGTWVRFRLDGTSRAWLLAAAFVMLAVVYLPHALYDADRFDPAGLSWGPASRVVFAALMVIAMSPMRVPKLLRDPRVTLLVLILAMAAVVDATIHTDWVLDQLGDSPLDASRNMEAAALVLFVVALGELTWLWWRTRRHFIVTHMAAIAAMATAAALMLPSHGWELRWWFAHLDLAVATAVYVVGTSGRMSGAIDERELRLHYQPKVNLRTGTLAGVEALLRWQHPQHGLVGSGEFIPTAEDTDLITPMTHWAVGEALRQHRAWLDEGLVIPVAVNVSARLFRDDELAKVIERELELNRLDASAITLELTESRALEGADAAVAMLCDLADRGVKLSVDDYGTGYSSLTYMKNLPVSELKLDRSFVTNMGPDDNDFIIVRSTIDLARKLGQTVVAEGIEDEEVRDLLTIMGCEVGQGYYWSRPLPADDLAEWARAFAQRGDTTREELERTLGIAGTDDATS